MFHFINVIALIIGYISTFLIIGYLLLYVISKFRKNAIAKVDASINSDKMPVLRPRPISTAKQHNPIDRLIAWVLGVREWELTQAFVFEFKDVSYVLHAGFIFDGASIPRQLWAVLSPVGLLLIPGLLHDYGYRYNGIYILNDAGEPEWSTDIEGKEAWDELFKAVGDEVNGMFILNAIATLGLYVGGLKAWNSWRDPKEPIPEMKWALETNQETNHKTSSETTH